MVKLRNDPEIIEAVQQAMMRALHSISSSGAKSFFQQVAQEGSNQAMMNVQTLIQRRLLGQS